MSTTKKKKLGDEDDINLKQYSILRLNDNKLLLCSCSKISFLELGMNK